MNNNITRVVIIGASNAFWEISELIDDINEQQPTYEIIDVLDDNLIGKSLDKHIVKGPIELASGYDDDVKFVFAIGSFKTRLIRSQILSRLNIKEDRFVTLIHPTAKIFKNVEIGHGCIIHYGSVVFNHTKVHSFVVIAANCVIAVGNLIGTGALFGSNITTTTGVKVGSYSFIGSSTSIGENIEVGAGAQVGMGSLVLKKVQPGSFILGHPPKILGKVDVSEEILENWEFEKSNKIV